MEEIGKVSQKVSEQNGFENYESIKKHDVELSNIKAEIIKKILIK